MAYASTVFIRVLIEPAAPLSGAHAAAEVTVAHCATSTVTKLTVWLRLTYANATRVTRILVICLLATHRGP